ncbi:MAG: hypothetical protein ACRC0B_02890 [Legionella sp.]
MTNKTNSIYESFRALEEEIKKLDTTTQINLYSATIQLIENVTQDNQNLISPIDVFTVQCNTILAGTNGAFHKIGLALGAVAIAVSLLVASAGIGLGIGVLLGVWQTPLMFMSALLAAETSALVVASASTLTGLGAGLIAGTQFFKTPKINTALDACIEQVKESQFSKGEELGDDVEESCLKQNIRTN